MQRHQTTMAKKMAKISHSDSFKSFKFRINPFISGFADSLDIKIRQHFDDKQIRSYLLSQRFLMRFTEEMKRCKCGGSLTNIVKALL